MTEPAEPMDLSKFNLEELQAMYASISREIQKRLNRERDEAKKKIRELAIAHGIDLKELVSRPSSREPNPPGTLMRNPDNPLDVWNGKGRKPDWYKRAMDAGIHPSELKVPDSNA